jgi:hypothetical protein
MSDRAALLTVAGRSSADRAVQPDDSQALLGDLRDGLHVIQVVWLCRGWGRADISEMWDGG